MISGIRSSDMRKLLALLLLLTVPASAGTLPLLGAGLGAPGGGGGVTKMPSPIMSQGSTTAPSATVINYGKMASGFTNGQWGVTAATQEEVWPVAGTIDNLEVFLPTDPATASSSYDVGLVLGGTKQTLVCNVPAGSHACTDSGAHPITVAPGNLVGWFVCPSTVGNTQTCPLATGSAVPTGQAAPVQVSATFTSTIGQESFILSHPNGNQPTASLQYVPFGGNTSWNNTEVNVSSVVPTAGTIDQLYVQLVNTPGTNGTYTLTVFHNTAATSLSCVVTSAVTTCTDTTGAHAFTVAQGDTISIQTCPSSSGNTLSCTGATGTAAPTARGAAVGVRWVPSTTNQAIVLQLPTAVPSTTATRFLAVNGTGVSSTTESNDINATPVVSGNMTVGNLTVLQSTAPGGVTTRAYTLRAGVAGGAAQSDRAPTCTVTSAVTTCTNASTYTATSGQALDISTTPTGTNAALTYVKTGMTVTIP